MPSTGIPSPESNLHRQQQSDTEGYPVFDRINRRSASVIGSTALATVAMLITALVALGVHENPAFELDGNTVNGLAAGEDWNDVFANTDTALASDFQHDEAEPDRTH